MARSKKTDNSVKQKPVTTQTPFPKIGQPALRALNGAGYQYLEQLHGVPEASLNGLHGFGPKALGILRDALKEMGLSFGSQGKTTSAPDNFRDLWCDDRVRQGTAYEEILATTSRPVDWAYEVWDDVIQQLKDKNNRSRSIAAQILCNLAQSDPSRRMMRDFPALFDVVNDERFVTARHALQAMWKVGCVSKSHREMLIVSLEKRFSDSVSHKNCTLIRYDIIQCLRNLFDAVHDETIKTRAKTLIELEDDLKYRKKYSTLWPKT